MATKKSSRKSSSKKTSSRSGSGSSRKGAASKRSSASKGQGGRGSAGSARKAAAKRGSKSSATRGSRSAGRVDAVKLLKDDHERVDAMFKRYDRMKEGDERKLALLEQILEELRVHAQIEEEIFYPALRTLFEEGEKKKELELMDEAEVEHDTFKWLMEQLESGDQADEAMRDAHVKVLSEYVKHHVEEEEGEMFKAARKVDLDLEEVGRQLDARKRQLMGEEPGGGEGGDAGMQVNEPAQMASAPGTH